MTNHSIWLPFLYLRVSNVRSQRGYPPFPSVWLVVTVVTLMLWPMRKQDFTHVTKNWSTWNFVNVAKSRNASDRCHGKENITHECHPKSFLQLYNPKSSWFYNLGRELKSDHWIVNFSSYCLSCSTCVSFYSVLLVFVETTRCDDFFVVVACVRFSHVHINVLSFPTPSTPVKIQLNSLVPLTRVYGNTILHKQTSHKPVWGHGLDSFDDVGLRIRSPYLVMKGCLVRFFCFAVSLSN